MLVSQLYRASHVAFPEEKVMEDARIFTTKYLQKSLTKSDILSDKNLLTEIKYALEYPWKCSVPRWEARNYIDVYGTDDAWLHKNLFRMSYVSNQKILELARLDFNIVQSQHQTELKLLSRWWIESGMSEVTIFRHRHVEYYLWGVLGAFEPEYSASRISVCKVSIMLTIFDDLYDTYGTIEEVRLFNEALKRWDVSITDCLPESMRICYKFIYKTRNELIEEATQHQSRDMFHHIQKQWEYYTGAYFQEAEWMADGYVPTLDEYIKNGKNSSAHRLWTMHPMLLMGQLISDDILRQLEFPASNLLELIGLSSRLADDTQDFEDEKASGELISSIWSYLKDNPEATEEDALNHINGIIDHSLMELNREFLKTDDIPLCCKKMISNISKGCQFFYRHGDGFSISSKEIKDQIFKILIHPVPI
eukprot:Gb_38696 [translate_table: standard]